MRLSREMLRRMAAEAEARGWLATQAQCERQLLEDYGEVVSGVVPAKPRRDLPMAIVMCGHCRFYLGLKRRAGIAEGSRLSWWWLAFVKAPMFPLQMLAWLVVALGVYVNDAETHPEGCLWRSAVEWVAAEALL